MDEKANKILIANITMVTADTEYPWAVPKNCIWFTLHVRDNSAVRIATEAGHVALSQPPYFTLKSNSAWNGEDLKISLKTGVPLFFASDGTGKVVEVIVGIYEPELDIPE